MSRDDVRGFLGWWVTCMVIWMALVDRVELDEVITGVVASAIAAATAAVVRSQRPVRARVRAVWIGRALRACAWLAADIPLLVSVLWRRGIRGNDDDHGRIVWRRTEATDRDDPTAVGDRIAEQTIGSLAPRSIVIDIDVDGGTILEHRLRSR